MDHRIINEVCNRIGAKFVTDIDAGMYQGTRYILLTKKIGGVSYYAIVMYDYGTCEMCDWQMALEENWRNDHPIDSISLPPLEIYEPMIHQLASQADKDEFASWRSSESLKKNFHMIFGVSSEEKDAEDYISKVLDKEAKVS